MFTLDERLQADTEYLGRFALSHVLLMKDARYPWVILVPAQTNLYEYYHLSKEHYEILMDESRWVTEKMADFFAAKSMNVAALGNVVAQLHVHHVVRFENDPAWPGPVWGHSPAAPYEAEALVKRVAELKQLLADRFVDESDPEAIKGSAGNYGD